jgi:hypothetical protein
MFLGLQQIKECHVGREMAAALAIDTVKIGMFQEP